MNKVSIVIATYNRCDLLRECIKSLLAQTHRDIEIVVVDDGSTDNTPMTVADIAQKHNNIRYYSRPHLGAPAARDFGLAQSKGDYIGFFDSDDLWPPNFVEVMVKSLQEKSNFDVAYSRIMTVVDGKICGQYMPLENPPTGYITAELFLRTKPFNLPSSTIFRKKVWEGISWDEKLKTCDDFDVFLQISTRAKFMFVPDVYVMYHKTQDSMSAAAAKNLSIDHIRVMEKFYFRLGGNSYVPKKTAFRRISHLYRNFALKHYRAGNKKASIALLKRALYYLPLDFRLYINMFQTLLLRASEDKMSDWLAPTELGRPANEL